MAIAGQLVLPDGRVEITPEADAALGESRLHNEDLAPVPIAKRTWTTYNYLALWIGMSINIPSWLLASGLIGLGMSWTQAIMTIFLGNLIVLVPMLLISHGGTKYGLPYPVLARASFGVFGANLPALVACAANNHGQNAAARIALKRQKLPSMSTSGKFERIGFQLV